METQLWKMPCGAVWPGSRPPVAPDTLGAPPWAPAGPILEASPPPTLDHSADFCNRSGVLDAPPGRDGLVRRSLFICDVMLILVLKKELNYEFVS